MSPSLASAASTQGMTGMPPAATSTATTASTVVPADAAHAPSGAAGVAGMLGSLALVITLIFALAWLARKLQGLRAARGDLVQVTGGVSVGGKERVVIVRVGNDHFLVGVASGQVSLLHRFVSAPGAIHVHAADSETTHAEVLPFADRLRELLRTRKAA